METNDFTLLVVSGPGVAPYSARGLQQTYDPINEAVHLERMVNGELEDFSAPQFRKYRSKVSCTDHNTPALSGVWPGTIVEVECVQEMSFKTDQPGDQEREAVIGSVRVEGDYTFYRPKMTFRFRGFSVSGQEYLHEVAWSFDLEEL